MPIIDVNSIFPSRKAHYFEELTRANLGKIGRSLNMFRLGIVPEIGTPRTSLK